MDDGEKNTKYANALEVAKRIAENLDVISKDSNVDKRIEEIMKASPSELGTNNKEKEKD